MSVRKYFRSKHFNLKNNLPVLGKTIRSSQSDMNKEVFLCPNKYHVA